MKKTQPIKTVLAETIRTDADQTTIELIAAAQLVQKVRQMDNHEDPATQLAWNRLDAAIRHASAASLRLAALDSAQQQMQRAPAKRRKSA